MLLNRNGKDDVYDPYDVNLQTRILGLIVQQPGIFTKVANLFSPVLFTDPIARDIAGSMMEFYGKYRKLPKYEDMLSSIPPVEQEQAELYKGMLQLIYFEDVRLEWTPEYLQDLLIEFCKRQRIYDSMQQGLKLLESNVSADEISRTLNAQLSDLAITNKKEIIITENVEERLKSYIVDDRDFIPTPLATINEDLHGGLFRNKLYVIYGVKKAGKTSLMIAFVAHMLMCDKVKIPVGNSYIVIPKKINVMYFSHELLAKDIVRKLEASITGISFWDFGEESKHATSVKKLMKALKKFKGEFRVEYIPEGTATISHLRSIVDQKRREGFAPDLIIDDMIDHCVPETRFHEYRHGLNDVWRAYRRWGLEENLYMLTATQVDIQAAGKAEPSWKQLISESQEKIGILDTSMTWSPEEITDKPVVNGWLRVNIARLTGSATARPCTLDRGKSQIIEGHKIQHTSIQRKLMEEARRQANEEEETEDNN